MWRSTEGGFRVLRVGAGFLRRPAVFARVGAAPVRRARAHAGALGLLRRLPRRPTRRPHPGEHRGTRLVNENTLVVLLQVAASAHCGVRHLRSQTPANEPHRYARCLTPTGCQTPFACGGCCARQCQAPSEPDTCQRAAPVCQVSDSHWVSDTVCRWRLLPTAVSGTFGARHLPADRTGMPGV